MTAPRAPSPGARAAAFLARLGPAMTRPAAVELLPAAVGAAFGIVVTGALLWLLAGQGSLWDHPMVIAPFAASAVLIFAVPSSPLAQPWAVVAGNGLAAAAGLAALALVPHPLPALALALR